ncbi:MAG: serine dehydratase subunit alpha family protein [Lachnospiraceae bacterium]|nr:serine dehydratase subunit alpha family protein [Lachnospiraceae bacterium]
MITKQEMLELLKQDVVPALGCTEPVCAALAAADAAKAVGGRVESIEAILNPNIYKNGMSVAIPGCDFVGLDAAVALGACLKNPEKKLQLLEDITNEVLDEVSHLLSSSCVKVTIDKSKQNIYVKVAVKTDCGVGVSVIEDSHTNIVKTMVNDTVVFEKDSVAKASGNNVIDRLITMKIAEIRQLVDSASEDELRFMLDGIEMNDRISAYGMENEVGVGITSIMKNEIGKSMIANDLMSKIMLKVMSAAEGRLGGCRLPSMSSSGAGTKGLVVIIPISETANAIGATTEMTVKAIAFGHLVNRYINAYIGKLAAVCSCVMASATAASAAMTWLLGGNDEQIGYAIRNMAGTVTGMICDGGKVGCALKVSMASSAALTNAILASKDTVLRVTDGICAETPEQCIKNMARIGNPGMLQADKEILNIMLEK